MEEIQPATLEDRIQHSMEKARLSKWLEVMQSGAKEASDRKRMSWTEVGEDEININGNLNPKSPVVTIDSDGIQGKIEYWSSTLVCYVLGTNPPLNVIEVYFKRIWGKLGIDKIALIRKGTFIVRFTSYDSCFKVKKKGSTFLIKSH